MASGNKTEITAEQVEAKCALFERTATPISIKAIARTLGINEAAIARRDDLRAIVERYRAKPAQVIKQRRTEYNEAIAQSSGPALRTYIDPNYVGLWNPRLGKEIEERERLRRKYSSRERFTQPGY